MSNGSPLYGRRAYEAFDGMERNGKWRKPTQHELDDWKSSLAPGTRIYVYGWGEGTVRGFIKSSGWAVHSMHEIDLRAEDRYARRATGPIKVRLQRKHNGETPWLKPVGGGGSRGGVSPGQMFPLGAEPEPEPEPGSPSGKVIVKLLHGKDLKSQKWAGDNAPYCTLRPKSFGAHNDQWRSAVAHTPQIGSPEWKRGKDPRWQETATFDFHRDRSAPAELELVCWHQAFMASGADTCIGECIINLEPVLLGDADAPWRARHAIYGRGRGTLHGEIELEISHSAAAPQPAPSATVPQEGVPPAAQRAVWEWQG